MTDSALETDVAVQVQFDKQKFFEDTFNLYYPKGVISDTNEDEVFIDALAYFVQEKNSYLPQEDYRRGDFGDMFEVTHQDGAKSYIASVTKTYTNQGQHIVDDELYLYDVDSRGLNTGKATITYIPTQNDVFEHGKPIVHFTQTIQDFQHQGLAIRRLIVMNAMTQSIYGLPLHSDLTHLSEYATASWEHLVREGKAEKFEDTSADGHTTYPRYRFKTYAHTDAPQQ